MAHSDDVTRRTLLKGVAGTTALVGIGMPAIVKAQSDVIRIGHLTPITGFLGPLGEFAQMGVQLAADEINAGGGVLGRKIELVMEDSVNPQTASAKAERLIERDKVAMIIGEISSASALAIGQVANRTKTVFINTGANSDALRGASCNPFMFHIEAANSMMVTAVGSYLKNENMIKGKKWYSLTADYAFGHDLFKAVNSSGRNSSPRTPPISALIFSRFGRLAPMSWRPTSPETRSRTSSSNMPNMASTFRSPASGSTRLWPGALARAISRVSGL
jgi:branched-chain amino acid transport system substrate-binding protein